MAGPFLYDGAAAPERAPLFVWPAAILTYGGGSLRISRASLALEFVRGLDVLARQVGTKRDALRLRGVTSLTRVARRPKSHNRFSPPALGSRRFRVSVRPPPAELRPR